jgi:hypothetical protein
MATRTDIANRTIIERPHLTDTSDPTIARDRATTARNMVTATIGAIEAIKPTRARKTKIQTMRPTITAILRRNIDRWP